MGVVMLRWRRWISQLHKGTWRYRLRRRLPGRLLRNLGLFYLILACGAGLLILSNKRPDFFQGMWQRAQHDLGWIRNKSIQALPVLAEMLPLTGDLPRYILAEGLPGSVAVVDAASRDLPAETLRSLVHVVTDYDLAEPESLVAAVFPGSRGTGGSLRWEWILQRSIQGYELGSITALGSSLDHIMDSLTEGVVGPDAEVLITAPEYGALNVVEPASSLDSGGVVTDVTDYPGELVGETRLASSPNNAVTRLEGLARVNWGTAPLVGIYHTHTGETYGDTGVSSKKSYAWDVAQPGSGPVPGVVQVGERITRELQRRYGIPAIHSTKVHDYPIFAYAYSNSEKTAQMLVERYSSLQIVLDIHRDEGATLETLQGRQLAGVLIVVAAGGGSLSHANWRANLAIAQQLKEDFDRLYPGLCRGLLVKEKARYNQHLHSGALLLEIGAHTDTLESALMTAELVADVLAETLWQLQSGSRTRTGPIRPSPLAPPSPMEIFEPKVLRPVFGL